MWEERPKAVLKRYPEVFTLERKFRSRGGLERFWGNHDDLWSHPRQVKTHLSGPLGDGIKVRESLRMRVTRSPGRDVTLFFVHGHQGTAESDRWGWLARLPVRFLLAAVPAHHGVLRDDTGQRPRLAREARPRHVRMG